MKRDPDQLRAWKQRSKRLSPVSKKRAKTFRARRALIEATVVGKPCLARWDDRCQGMAVTAHEPLLRSQGSDPTDEAQTLAVCSACHDAIHQNVAEAYERGLLKHRWEE